MVVDIEQALDVPEGEDRQSGSVMSTECKSSCRTPFIPDMASQFGHSIVINLTRIVFKTLNPTVLLNTLFPIHKIID